MRPLAGLRGLQNDLKFRFHARAAFRARISRAVRLIIRNWPDTGVRSRLFSRASLAAQSRQPRDKISPHALFRRLRHADDSLSRNQSAAEKTPSGSS